MKPAHILAVGLLLAAGAFTMMSFGGAIAPHVTIAEARQRAGETVQVPGKIVKESVSYDPVRGVLRFDILGIDPKTKKPKPDERLTIVYGEPKPENFDTADGVEAVGQFRDGVFHARNLLVKCPSKYNDQPAADRPAGG